EANEVYAWPESKKVFEAWIAELEKFSGDRLSEADFNAAQDAVKNVAGVKGKNLFMPIRVAVIGQPHGAELKILVPLLPKMSLLQRAKQALAKV
ncbi:MAG TPA: hypothetical protein VM432_11700, partial [Bdellovibrionales bacterium]|nr:hypothetical protein [Bdellovibrionales bacterium]